jgi:mRNA interferase MazF
VVWVALDPTRGTEIRKTRPAGVISKDSCNRYGSRVVVLPVTSNVSSLYPGEARIDVAGKPARVAGPGHPAELVALALPQEKKAKRAPSE